MGLHLRHTVSAASAAAAAVISQVSPWSTAVYDSGHSPPSLTGHYDREHRINLYSGPDHAGGRVVTGTGDARYTVVKNTEKAECASRRMTNVVKIRKSWRAVYATAANLDKSYMKQYN